MHFVKALVSFVAVAMPMGALAAPSASTEGVANRNINLDDLLDNHPPSKRELAIRQGNTCAFGGDALCTSRVSSEPRSLWPERHQKC